MSDARGLALMLERARAGDAEALNRLLEKLRPWVCLLIRRQLGALAADRDGSDLVQESLLRVWRGFGKFTGQEVPALLNWVARIAKNVVFSDGRYQGADRRDRAREMHGSALLKRLMAEGSTPEQRAERDEAAARLTAAFDRLPEPYRQVIEARFFDQLSFAEIGQAMGRSERAVRLLCFRAIKRLRKELEGGL